VAGGVTEGMLIAYPKWSGWECELFGSDMTLVLRPSEGHVPNWFWRWTQYIIFGNKWVYIGEDK